jgi:uncharacterized protein involved in exopolysaccharide biosynthesis
VDAKSTIEALWNRRRAIVIGLVVGLLIALLADVRMRPTYTANASVLIVPGTASDSDGVPTTTTKPLVSDDLPMLAQTSTVLYRVSHDLGGTIGTGALAGRIRAEVYENSNVMRIRFLGDSQQQAITGANAVAQEVVDYYRAIATSRFDSLAADLKRQLASRQQELRVIDAQLQRETATYPFVEDSPGAAGDTSIDAVLVHLQTERDELSATLSGDTAQANVTDERAAEAVPSAREELESQDPFYRNVLNQYGHDAAQLRFVKTQFSSRYPGLPELKEIVNNEQAALSGDEQRISAKSLTGTQAYASVMAEENKAHSQVANDRAKLARINDTIAALQGELKRASTGGVSVAALRRERESASTAYQLLSTRLITTLADRAAAASTGSLMVFDYASYAQPSPYTRPVLMTAAIMMASLWIAISIAFGLESLDRRFRNAATIETVYGSPVLGVI